MKKSQSSKKRPVIFLLSVFPNILDSENGFIRPVIKRMAKMKERKKNKQVICIYKSCR